MQNPVSPIGELSALAAQYKGRADFTRIPRADWPLMQRIADRAVNLARLYRKDAAALTDEVIESNVTLLQIDVATVHFFRRLKLKEFLECDDLTFMAEFALIQKNINRPLVFFPADVTLRFAQVRAIN
jgi:hypothetical protein